MLRPLRAPASNDRRRQRLPDGAAARNVDGAGFAEIIVAGQVTRYIKGFFMLQVVFNNPAPTTGWGTLSTVADLDGDGRPELIAGNAIYDAATGADRTPTAITNLAWDSVFAANVTSATPGWSCR